MDFDEKLTRINGSIDELNMTIDWMQSNTVNYTSLKDHLMNRAKKLKADIKELQIQHDSTSS